MSLSPEQQSRAWAQFWIGPLAFGLVGAVEIARQLAATGGELVATMVALAVALSIGVPLGIVSGLTYVLLARRAWSLTRYSTSSNRLTAWAAILLGCGLTGIAYLAVQVVHDIADRRPIDAAEGSVELWRSALFLVVVPSTLAAVGLFIAVRRWIASEHWTIRLRWLVLGGTFLGFAWHVCGGISAMFLGRTIPWALLGVAWLLLVLAVRSGRIGRGTPWKHALAGGALWALGTVGFHHPGARALLLHDARVLPPLADAMMGVADPDGDGDWSTWFGGGDCDSFDPNVASNLPEIPENGIDDNCHLGDASPALPPSSVLSRDASERPDAIILVTIDTLRADHLELHGYPRATMPALTAYASSARRWSQAYSPSNHTAFSVLSLLSGQSPEFLIHADHARQRGQRRFTHWLPQRLGAAGYHTVAINPPLVVTGELTPAELRFDVLDFGPFDYHAKNRGTMSKQLVDAAIHRVRDASEPLFLWLHLPDPHARHESYVVFDGNTSIDAYDNELRWVDMHLARLLAAIEQRFGDRAAVAITSDHGEALGDHGDWGHGYTLYEGAVKVPLVLRAPGIEPSVVDTPTSIGGLAAALLELAGQPIGMRTTYPSLFDPHPAPVVVACPFFWSEQRMEVALVLGDWKLIYNRQRGTSLLFNVVDDPHERHNRAADESDRREQLEAEMWSALEQLR